MLANSLAILFQQMQKFTDIMVAIGMPLAEEKTLGPGPVIRVPGHGPQFHAPIAANSRQKESQVPATAVRNDR